MGKEMKHFTLRAMGYASVSAAAFVTALVLSSELFLAASLMSAALFILSLSLYPRRCEVTREMEKDTVFEGEKVRVSLNVSDQRHLGNLEIFDRVSPMLELAEGSNLASLSPGSRGFDYTINASIRGYHRIGPTFLRRWDPLFLWFKEEEIGNPSQLTVFPRISPGRAGELILKDRKYRPGDMRLKRVGLGKEFHSIRDYTTTDPFNTINWKATARTRKLLVNQFEAESVTDVMFILDSRLVSRVGTIRDNPVERCIRFCASLSNELLNRSNRVGLIIYGSSVNVMKPAAGSGAHDQILHMLTNSTPAGQITLGASITYSLPYLPPNSPIFILSALNEDPTIRDAVKQLIGRGHKVTIVSPSGIEFEKGVYDNKVIPKYVLKRIERDNLLLDLRAVGARVIDWDPSKDVIWAMEEVWK
ncbi:MAG TPA: DUF58 domain-containing protein [Euryarchaeota archaeon]|nr:MAG: hypothetical protein B6U90_04810 [Thermoplasmatales archaeon ex4484_6]RLF65976.1 MAG: hypothetical protein DRN57_08015 [Thermoplasmata archaeon]HHD15361.1 DUF58 domain-containing protein [Euryarchaeota archaeon]